jgi:hypothetical protein
MSIAKQDFYEGAALNLLARTGGIVGIVNYSPFYVLNGRLAILLKYSTRGRSPWGFTVTENEKAQLRTRSEKLEIAIGLICGSDGVVYLNYESLMKLAGNRDGPVHISCYRDHGEHYEVNGPEGPLPNKIPPSNWSKVLDLTRVAP